MMSKIYEPTQSMWQHSLYNLYKRGELTLEQYAACVRRTKLYNPTK